MRLHDYLVSQYRVNHLGIKPSSMEQMRITVRLFSRHLGRDATLDDLNAERIGTFLADYLESGRSPATVNAKRRQLLSLWADARRTGMCDNDVVRLRSAREQIKLPEAWSTDHLQAIFRQAEQVQGEICGIRAADWWLSLCRVLACTGERISACLSVLTANVNLDQRLIVSEAISQKTSATRLLVLTELAAAACRRIYNPNRWLMWPFPATREQLDQSFVKLILGPAGVPYGRGRGGLFHKFRRTSGSLVEQAGGDGARHLGNTPEVFRRNYFDPRVLPPRSVELLEKFGL